MKANYEDAIATISQLESAGYRAYLAGGCVRDLLLGVTPNDYDVTTSATPEQVQKLFDKTIPVGISFGVIKVVRDGRELDVATFRKDGKYSDNRKPDSVEYSISPEEDVKRRDFTINALLMDTDHNTLDYINGQEDLRNRILRAVGNPKDRFEEDALRMMRAIRFAVRFNMTIHPDTWNAIVETNCNIKSISKERITEELVKIFSHGNCDRSYWLLQQSGLWTTWFGSTLGDNDKYNIMVNLSRVIPGEDFILPLSITMTRNEPTRVKEGLTLTNAQKKGLEGIQNKYFILKNFLCERISSQRKIMQWEDLSIIRRYIDCVCPFGKEEVKVVESLQKQALDMGFPEPIVNGDTLLSLGYKASPLFSQMLDQIFNEQLENKITSVLDAQVYLGMNFPAVPRTLENGTEYNGMSRVNMMARCPGCKAPMGFSIERDEKGKPLWRTTQQKVNVYFTHSSVFVFCTLCDGRKMKKKFKEVAI